MILVHSSEIETLKNLYFKGKKTWFIREESEVEGVKAEVAFAQAMMETGFLKFGGDVKKDQYNFAG